MINDKPKKLSSKMGKVLMDGFTVHNVEPCPVCHATQYARKDVGIMSMIIMCCDSCDYEAPGAIMMRGTYSLKSNKETFIEATRHMFNFWNKAVGVQYAKQIKRVRILQIK